MKKLSNSEVELKKSVAYKKKRIYGEIKFPLGKAWQFSIWFSFYVYTFFSLIF